MATGATLAAEHLLTAGSKRVRFVRVGWGFKLIHIECQRIELLITVPANNTGIARLRQLADVRGVNGNESTVAGQIVASLIQRGIAHEIHNRAMR